MIGLALLVVLGVNVVASSPATFYDNPPPDPGVFEPTIAGKGETPFARFPHVPRNGTTVHELDLILTHEQRKMLFDPDPHSRVRRKAWKGNKFRWTQKTMPYEFNGNDFTAQQKREIREAMDVYEKETCVKFRPARPSDVNKVLFREGKGCSSQLGMVGGTQDLFLDSNGCRWKGLYWHEMGHALGLVHEHQLPERDKFIKVNFMNVDPALSSAFTKYKDSELERFGIPYDLSSVMHYEIKAFSQTGGQTIIPRDKSKEPWIGNVWISQMSFTDVMIVNRMYKCAEHCGSVNCQGGFVNKECKCVTPKSYFDSHCINEHPNEAECYERAHKGECDRDYGFMNFKCRKACDRCAMYGMEHLIKGKPGECFNQYFDDAKCDAWAKAGDCDRYPSWMKRQCKKSCGTCNSKWGKCANMEFDYSCDDWAKRGECDGNPEWMKNKCPDSCNTCGYITRGKCNNDHPKEDECFKWSRAGQCVDDDVKRAIWMKKNCAASCNSCGFSKGNCQNDLDDFTCDKMAHEGKCVSDPTNALKNCKKSCNSCDYGIVGNCKNLYDELYQRSDACPYWAAHGSCKVSPGWYTIMCASSCNKCQEAKDLVANCRDVIDEKKCKGFVERGECDNNPGFMRFNCAKSCKSCYVLTSDKICTDYGGKYNCGFWKNKGECTNNAYWMSQNCRLTCNKCQSGERRVDDPGWPKCTNIKPDSECDNWATSGECKNNKLWMEHFCHRSCFNLQCGGKTDLTNPCVDKNVNCTMWAGWGHCKYPGYMDKNCYKACHPQECGSSGGRATSRPIPATKTPPTKPCIDEYKECPTWHSWGHCQLNPTVMKHCPKSCGTC